MVVCVVARDDLVPASSSLFLLLFQFYCIFIQLQDFTNKSELNDNLFLNKILLSIFFINSCLN